jgi:lysophospholipase L1-like esterase
MNQQQQPPGRREWLATMAALGAFGALPSLTGCAAPSTASSTTPTAVNTDPPPLQIPRQLPEPANPALPSLVLIGDSTVRNGQDDGQKLGPAGQWGWGHVVARYIDASRFNVVNRAIGGLSSRTYRSGGHWARTQAFVKRGDVVLMQFGHNDSGALNDRSRARGTLRGTGPEKETIDNLLTGQRETVGSYGAYLRNYVADIRAAGATPVIASPVPRKRFDEQGRTLRGTNSYATWAETVAREMGVAFINLDADIAARYDAIGPAVVDMLFPRATPEERTHTNWAGAALNAQVALDGLRAHKLLPESAFLRAAFVQAAAPARKPTLHLVGDSTVRSAGQAGNWGWGEYLAERLDTRQMALANHAIGGRSTRTFLREGRWETVRAQLRPGDVLLIQFGHNDGGKLGDPGAKNRGVVPGTGPETFDETLLDGGQETVRSFGAYLSRYLREALDAGVVPVVLSPVPHKDRWQSGRDFEDFSRWGRETAAREGALFLDLTLVVTEAYKQLGAAGVEGLFADARTHTNVAGARLNAACVAKALRELPQALMTPYLLADNLAS